jgi:DNA-binding GntR family transcriptional regulator
MPISRIPLGIQVSDDLTRRIYSGELEPSSKISDVTLAEQLGVSRTPVREALNRLVLRGFLQSEAGKGFVVRPLVARDVLEGYPILWTLECLALRTSTGDPVARADRMDALNARSGDALGNPEALIALDDAWHKALVDGCPNRQLLELIDTSKLALRRYEFAYMRDEGNVSLSVEQHAAISSLVRGSRVSEAVEALERHWISGMNLVVDWLERTLARAGSAAN